MSRFVAYTIDQTWAEIVLVPASYDVRELTEEDAREDDQVHVAPIGAVAWSLDEQRWVDEAEAAELADGFSGLLYPLTVMGINVDDGAGGHWRPSAEAKAQILAAEDQGLEALAICALEPTRGQWHS